MGHFFLAQCMYAYILSTLMWSQYKDVYF